MASQLKDLAEFEDPDLHLIYRKKKYTVPAASFSLGKYLYKVMDLGMTEARHKEAGTQPTEEEQAEYESITNDAGEEDFIVRCLGEKLMGKMEADGVPYKIFSLMAQTLMMDTTQSRDVALAYWNASGKAPAPASGQTTATQTPEDEGTTTKPQDYRSTTKTPAKAKATTGRTSSSTGKK